MLRSKANSSLKIHVESSGSEYSEPQQISIWFSSMQRQVNDTFNSMLAKSCRTAWRTMPRTCIRHRVQERRMLAYRILRASLFCPGCYKAN